MRRTFLWAIGVAALAAAGACSSETDGGGGGTGGTTSSGTGGTTSSGTGGTTSSGTGGTTSSGIGGAGGGGPCKHCFEYLDGTSSYDDLCPASQTLLEAFGACACGSGDGGGSAAGLCSADCGDSLCADPPVDSTPACDTCSEQQCGSELDACNNDSG